MVAALGIEEGPASSGKRTKISATSNLQQRIYNRMAGCFDALPHQAHFDWDTKRNKYSAIAAGFLVKPSFILFYSIKYIIVLLGLVAND
jgi:hypothetical protein